MAEGSLSHDTCRSDGLHVDQSGSRLLAKRLERVGGYKGVCSGQTMPSTRTGISTRETTYPAATDRTELTAQLEEGQIEVGPTKGFI